MGVVIVIPTYNEADNLPAIIAALFELNDAELGVLVVDDNSPDGTGQVAEQLRAQYAQRVHVLHRPQKGGLGSAYVAGFREALRLGATYIVQMDADFSHSPTYIPRMLDGIKEYDVVVGSRYVAGGGMEGVPGWRRAISVAGNAVGRLLLGVPIRDITGVVPSDILIEGVTIHDVQSHDLTACHIEGLAIFAGRHITVRGSRFYGNSIYDALIVGGGHNGLTAAAYLARAGLSTLVLERREIVGGCCVTEEIAPGCLVSTTSYIASMLRPEVIADLRLADHGLRMVPCDPAIQVPFPDGHVVPWWVNRERAKAEFAKISEKDATRFVEIDDRLKKLARYLQPFFMEPPPEIDPSSLGGWTDLLRVGKRFRGISSADIAQLISFLTGSLGEFFD